MMRAEEAQMRGDEEGTEAAVLAHTHEKESPKSGTEDAQAVKQQQSWRQWQWQQQPW